MRMPRRSWMPFALAALLAAISVAAHLTPRDTGTFVVLDRDFKPTELQYRLSSKSTRWVRQGKKPGAPWEAVSYARGHD